MDKITTENCKELLTKRYGNFTFKRVSKKKNDLKEVVRIFENECNEKFIITTDTKDSLYLKLEKDETTAVKNKEIMSWLIPELKRIKSLNVDVTGKKSFHNYISYLNVNKLTLKNIEDNLSTVLNREIEYSSISARGVEEYLKSKKKYFFDKEFESEDFKDNEKGEFQYEMNYFLNDNREVEATMFVEVGLDDDQGYVHILLEMISRFSLLHKKKNPLSGNMYGPMECVVEIEDIKSYKNIVKIFNSLDFKRNKYEEILKPSKDIYKSRKQGEKKLNDEDFLKSENEGLIIRRKHQEDINKRDNFISDKDIQKSLLDQVIKFTRTHIVPAQKEDVISHLKTLDLSKSCIVNDTFFLSVLYNLELKYKIASNKSLANDKKEEEGGLLELSMYEEDLGSIKCIFQTVDAILIRCNAKSIFQDLEYNGKEVIIKDTVSYKNVVYFLDKLSFTDRIDYNGINFENDEII